MRDGDVTAGDGAQLEEVGGAARGIGEHDVGELVDGVALLAREVWFSKMELLWSKLLWS